VPVLPRDHTDCKVCQITLALLLDLLVRVQGDALSVHSFPHFKGTSGGVLAAESTKLILVPLKTLLY
jgi:hypothetical protein